LKKEEGRNPKEASLKAPEEEELYPPTKRPGKIEGGMKQSPKTKQKITGSAYK